MSNDRKRDTIDLRAILRTLWGRRRLFIKVLLITAVVASALILCVPRYYSCSVRLAPEISGAGSSSLSSLASSFLGGNNNMTTDAIYPALYPDLVSSNDFIVSLFPIRVKSLEGDIDTTYYAYMKDFQRLPWWEYPMGAARKLMKKLRPKKKGFGGGGADGPDPFMLSEMETKLVQDIKGSIGCGVDKKTEVITINVSAQDPLICATMADSVRVRLQSFITEYRTNKARVDLDYYEQLTATAKQEYDEARLRYAHYSDANMDLRLAKGKGRLEDLENDLQIKFSNYTTFNSQLQMAIAKVQEKTPAFTIVQGATVPTRPAGPRRAMFVLMMMFLAFIVTCCYALKDDVMKALRTTE